MKTNQEVINYVESKLNNLNKTIKLSFYFNVFLRWSIILLNLIIIGLAVYVIYLQVNWYEKELKIENPEATFLEATGLTVVLAIFIVSTFLINLFLSFYSAVMKYLDYHKAMKEMNYIYLKTQEDKQYTSEDFEKDFQEIKKVYLSKKQVDKKQILKKFIMGSEK